MRATRRRDPRRRAGELGDAINASNAIASTRTRSSVLVGLRLAAEASGEEQDRRPQKWGRARRRDRHQGEDGRAEHNSLARLCPRKKNRKSVSRDALGRAGLAGLDHNGGGECA